MNVAGKPLRQGDLSMGNGRAHVLVKICVLNMEEPHLFVKNTRKNAWYEHPSVKKTGVDCCEMDVYIRKNTSNIFNIHLHQNICYKGSMYIA